MSQINPLVGSIIQTPLVQRQQAADRAAHTRQQQQRVKNSGLHGTDAFEHQVESAQAVAPSHDEEKREQNHKPSAEHDAPDDGPAEEDNPHLDLTA